MNTTRVFACLLGIVAPLAAQQPEKAVGVRDASFDKPVRVYTRLHALCIGINDYASPDVPDLSYAEADARDLAEVLKTLYGFDEVRTLIGREATKIRINDALADLFDPNHISADDAVIIYFSGHGQTVKQGSAEGGYLIPQDARISLADVKNPAPYRRDALRMDDLRTDADGVPAKHVLFLIDACYSGYMAARSVEVSPDMAAALRYPARQVITAGTAGEQSLEHNAWGHGALTYKLLEILRAEDRPLQASRLGVMLKERVPREVVSKFGDKRTLSPQAKYLSGEGDFLFVRASATANVPAATQPSTNSGPDSKPVNTAATTKPAAVKPTEVLPLDLVEPKSRERDRKQPPNTNAGNPMKTATPGPSKPTRAKRVNINLNGPVGPAPHFLTYRVDLATRELNGAQFLWMDNGVRMGDQPSGSKVLDSPGLHRISVLVITKDNQEYRGAATVNVLERK